MRRLSRRERLLLIVGGITLVSLLVTSYVILPFYEAQSRQVGELELKNKLVQRSFQKIQQQNNFEVQLAEVEQRLEKYRQKLLDHQDPKVARIQLEEVVRDLAAQHDIKVTRSNPLPEKKVGDHYVKIALQINLEADMGELTNFLYAISTYAKFLLVEEFSLSTYKVRNKIRVRPRLNISSYIRLS